MREPTRPTKKANKPKHQPERIEVEPGADKRLANILKRALNTPPKHVPAKGKKIVASKT